MTLLEVAIYINGHFAGLTKVACPEVRGEPIEIGDDTELLVTEVTPDQVVRVVRGELKEIGSV